MCTHRARQANRTEVEGQEKRSTLARRAKRQEKSFTDVASTRNRRQANEEDHRTEHRGVWGECEVENPHTTQLRKDSKAKQRGQAFTVSHPERSHGHCNAVLKEATRKHLMCSKKLRKLPRLS